MNYSLTEGEKDAILLIALNKYRGAKWDIFLLISYNLKTKKRINPKLRMFRPCSLLLKLQKFYKQNLDCYYGNKTTSSCVAVSYFPGNWSKVRHEKKKKNTEIKSPIMNKKKKKKENQHLKWQELNNYQSSVIT